MKLAVFYVALWMFISLESVFCASLKVKRDVEIIPAVFSGVVDTALTVMDQFGKGFAIRGSSKTDVGK